MHDLRPECWFDASWMLARRGENYHRHRELGSMSPLLGMIGGVFTALGLVGRRRPRTPWKGAG